ncbi:hypothetical protein EXIGLDRAFT_829279 [Exidia glandulosa HHB12029]|uniref:Prohibitin n=1 Tax=Exidia glandulosa HHB12029 TaxID=1314781 RepID=A0A165PMI4_EXIGL|nr:hypothetical protein EXIGLDRAFT_829279 [Exidia glandulosa HHB12029]
MRGYDELAHNDNDNGQDPIAQRRTDSYVHAIWQLEDVSITHLTFGQEFTQAVEAKQIAQQDAERAKFVVEKAEQERQAAVIRAEGEAEAAATISRAIDKAGEAFITLRRIEASKAIVQSLAANRNVTWLPSSGGNVLLNVPAGKNNEN